MEKKVIIFLLVLIGISNANAQKLETVEFSEFYNTYRLNNPLIVLSENSSNPFNYESGTCRKLCSEITEGTKCLWARYYFQDCNLEDLWYKGFSFYKLLKPTTNFKSSQYALYDVANKCFMGYSNHVDSDCYMYIRTDYSNKNFYEYYTLNDKPKNIEKRCLHLKVTDREKYEWCCTKISNDGRKYLYFDPQDKLKTYTTMYAFTNADFINDDIPDSLINTSANYLFLNRDYKLGSRYNTVIFPVTVKVHSNHHLYANGKNKMEIYKLESITENCLNFVKDLSGVLEANTPYIIKSEDNDGSLPNEIQSEYYLSEEPVSTFDINCIKKVMACNDTEVYAQYYQKIEQKKDALDPSEDMFILSGNKLVSCRNIKTTTVKRFRWFIKRQRSSAPLILSLDGVSTGIDNAEHSAAMSGRAYDLSGRAFGSASSCRKNGGLFISNGRVSACGEDHDASAMP